LVAVPRRGKYSRKAQRRMGVCGAWVFKDTRMPAQTVFENLEAGANIDDLIEWFDGLEHEQVKAVIQFVVRSLDKEPAHAPSR
jgi:uncharacterized protein (DUF433 family)